MKGEQKQMLQLVSKVQKNQQQLDFVYRAKKLLFPQLDISKPKQVLIRPLNCKLDPRFPKKSPKTRHKSKIGQSRSQIQIQDDSVKLQEAEAKNKIDNQTGLQIRYYTKIMNNYFELKKYDQSLLAFAKLEKLYQLCRQHKTLQFADVLSKVAEIYTIIKRYAQAQKALHTVVNIRQGYRDVAEEYAKKLRALKQILNIQEIQLEQRREKQKLQLKIEKPLIMVQVQQQKDRNVSLEKSQDSFQSSHKPQSEDMDLFKYLMQKGNKLEAQKRFKLAIKSYQQAENLYQQQKIIQEESFCQLLSSLANCHQQLNDNRTSKAILLRKQHFLQEKGLHESVKMGKLLYDIGYNELYLQNCESSLDYLCKGLQILVKVMGEGRKQDLVRFIEGVIGIACQYKKGNEYQQIKKIFLLASKLFQELKLESSEEFAAINQELAKAYCYLKEYSLSNQYNFQALKIMEQLGQSESFRSSRTYNNIGANYKFKWQVADAIRYYEKAVAIRKKLLGDEQDSQLADYYQNLGCVNEDLKKYVAAEKYYTKQLEIRKMKNQKQSPQMNECFFNLLRVTYKLCNYEGFMARVEQSLEFSNLRSHKSELKRMLDHVIKFFELTASSKQKVAVFLDRTQVQLRSVKFD